MKTTEPCWNCGSDSFTNSKTSHHLSTQIICAECYEPQDEDETYFEVEEAWY